MTRVDPLDRFAAFVALSDHGCLLWQGGQDQDGYGIFWADGTSHRAHLWYWRLVVGPIPHGMTLDHLCRTPACVLPSHLEVVTVGENTRRGVAAQRRSLVLRPDQAKCAKGLHDWTPENTNRPPSGHRYCVPCRAEYDRVRNAR